MVRITLFDPKVSAAANCPGGIHSDASQPPKPATIATTIGSTKRDEIFFIGRHTSNRRWCQYGGRSE